MKLWRRLFGVPNGEFRQQEQIQQSCERVHEREMHLLQKALDANSHQHNVLTELVEEMQKRRGAR